MNWGDYFYYDESSPSCLRWKVDRQRGLSSDLLAKAGDAAGGLPGNSYYRVKLDGVKYMVHQIIWEMANGPIPDGYEIDHENGDKSCNRIGNLRCVTKAVNQHNRKKPVTNTSGVTGVSLTTKRSKDYWRASWREDGKLRNKCYSVEEHGNEEAFKLACGKRAAMIQRVNEAGAEYTERHGM